MDAVEYLKTKRKMCATFHSSCINCPLRGNCDSLTDPERNVKAVEEWAKEHSPKTRKSEFIRLFPNTNLTIGIPAIEPCLIDKERLEDCEKYDSCAECMREYWNEEIE